MHFLRLAFLLSSVLVAFLGSLDCLTTVVGVLCFGGVELNPFIAELVHSDIAVFIVLKLVVTAFAAAVPVAADRALKNIASTFLAQCSKSHCRRLRRHVGFHSGSRRHASPTPGSWAT